MTAHAPHITCGGRLSLRKGWSRRLGLIFLQTKEMIEGPVATPERQWMQ